MGRIEGAHHGAHRRCFAHEWGRLIIIGSSVGWRLEMNRCTGNRLEDVADSFVDCHGQRSGLYYRVLVP
jgi:hypothetical protein